MDYLLTFKPLNKTIKARSGETVLAAAKRHRVHIPTRCGAKAGCLMCKIQVENDQRSQLSPPGEAEIRKLGSLIEQGYRLSCQTRVIGNAEVMLPEDPLKAAVRKQLEAARAKEQDDLW